VCVCVCVCAGVVVFVVLCCEICMAIPLKDMYRSSSHRERCALSSMIETPMPLKLNITATEPLVDMMVCDWIRELRLCVCVCVSVCVSFTSFACVRLRFFFFLNMFRNICVKARTCLRTARPRRPDDACLCVCEENSGILAVRVSVLHDNTRNTCVDPCVIDDTIRTHTRIFCAHHFTLILRICNINCFLRCFSFAMCLSMSFCCCFAALSFALLCSALSVFFVLKNVSSRDLVGLCLCVRTFCRDFADKNGGLCVRGVMCVCVCAAGMFVHERDCECMSGGFEVEVVFFGVLLLVCVCACVCVCVSSWECLLRRGMCVCGFCVRGRSDIFSGVVRTGVVVCLRVGVCVCVVVDLCVCVVVSE